MGEIVGSWSTASTVRAQRWCVAGGRDRLRRRRCRPQNGAGARTPAGPITRATVRMRNARGEAADDEAARLASRALHHGGMAWSRILPSRASSSCAVISCAEATAHRVHHGRARRCDVGDLPTQLPRSRAHPLAQRHLGQRAIAQVASGCPSSGARHDWREPRILHLSAACRSNPQTRHPSCKRPCSQQRIDGNLTVLVPDLPG